MTTSVVVTLVIYAYSSFVASWGPGPTLVSKFEKNCVCKVNLIDAGDGGALLSRLKLEGENSRADLVVGFDESQIPRVQSDLGWQQKMTAFDYGPYAFVYNSKTVSKPPHSLDDLLDPQWKGQVAIEDPRLSTAGLGLLLWIITEKKEGAWEYLKKLKPQVKIVAPSWDLAYGLFKKNQVQLVFSYWTSPAYHIQEEHTDAFKAAEFHGGHYVQREYMTVNPHSKNQDLATKFLDFMMTKEAQEELPKKNFMYPVNEHASLTSAFKKIGRPKILKPLLPEELRNLPQWLKKWREIFS